MSYDIFKQNMLSYMQNQRSIGSMEDFAAKLVQEYDALVKRGFDTVNGISVKQGNPQSMYSTLLGVLNTAFQQSSGEHAILTNMGPAFQAYWLGVSEFTPPAPTPVETFELSEEDVEEGEAIKKDINVEYPKTQKIYEQSFGSSSQALSHNKDVNRDEVIQRQAEIQSNQPPSDAPVTSLPKSAKGVGKDLVLLEKCGNGIWPALGQGPSPNFQVQSSDGARTWYAQNPEYIKKNCTQIIFPTSGGGKKITVHKDLAAVVQPAINEIKAKGLQKYIENCAGGLAVRNVTGGTRLSNHSWGTAIDMNTIKYPYGVKFGADGIYTKAGKIREFTDFDKGFLEVAAIFKSKGMTWLRNFDPMHVSIYE